MLENDKSLAKRGRGSLNARVEKEESMVILKWYDNKSVTLISSYCATESQDKVQRWSKSDKAFVEVNRPHIVKEYNTFMGGIDLLDACVARYKYHMRSRRWYLYLFWQVIMLGLVNGWLIYCRDCKLLSVQKPLKQRSFQAENLNQDSSDQISDNGSKDAHDGGEITNLNQDSSDHNSDNGFENAHDAADITHLNLDSSDQITDNGSEDTHDGGGITVSTMYC
ncbi:piggyBac transposable element-derived protein 3-like protein [Lates japonicus]|uniref:PiggyBac transposable element-derived protein 3-like protein n=1 Tax=Lates japonicus TaxID=270547 RepID=A0AAD3RLZ5_LATJO|nr:piggyBac transposable element-derived protein 3-like protein [Lates japonicus]GLD72886.1 piggyBac transposable element-derived protein 3-like protein [Lates japonicus]